MDREVEGEIFGRQMLVESEECFLTTDMEGFSENEKDFSIQNWPKNDTCGLLLHVMSSGKL